MKYLIVTLVSSHAIVRLVVLNLLTVTLIGSCGDDDGTNADRDTAGGDVAGETSDETDDGTSNETDASVETSADTSVPPDTGLGSDEDAGDGTETSGNDDDSGGGNSSSDVGDAGDGTDTVGGDTADYGDGHTTGETEGEVDDDSGGDSAQTAEDTGGEAETETTVGETSDTAGEATSGDVGGEPYPYLVLVHGYLGKGGDWDTAVAAMAQRGWDKARIVAPTLGNTNDSIITLAGKVKAAVDQIVAKDPDATIDIVGHSLGGPVVRWYVSQLGGHERARHVVTIAGANHGNDAACATAILGFASSEQLCPAWAKQSESEDLVQYTLNGDPNVVDVDETPFGVEDGGHIFWNAIAFTRDLIVIPHEVQCLDSATEGDCPTPVNIKVDWQGVDHIGLIKDTRFFDLLKTLLDQRQST